MKILIPTIIPCYLSTIILSGCSNAKNSNHETVGTLHSDDIEAIVEDTIFTSSEYFEEKEKSEYRGNLIVEYDNIKMYADFCLSEEDSKYGDDITAKDETYLIRYVNDIPRDTMILKRTLQQFIRKELFLQDNCWNRYCKCQHIKTIE